jgi:hypothetical protein
VLTRQPFCTAGATHPLARAEVERARYIPFSLVLSSNATCVVRALSLDQKILLCIACVNPAKATQYDFRSWRRHLDLFPRRGTWRRTPRCHFHQRCKFI